MPRAVTHKFLVYPKDIASFIHLVKIFRDRVEISHNDIHYNPDADMFICDIYFYNTDDSILFQNIAVTFIQCKYVDPGITE
jgi:hypothetical protein